MSKPVIGLSSSYNYDSGSMNLNSEYYKAIIKAGGIPVVIPPVEEMELLDELIEKFDGILLTGGPDLDARRFGEQNMPFNGSISPERDNAEIYLAKRAVEYNKPILGICRGVQVINVALGGTLYQDIASQVTERKVMKHSQEAPRWYPVHDIHIKNDTRALKWFGKSVSEVNSFHHQAVKDLAPGFKVAAYADDGIIEAIECDDLDFAAGVQWHPEHMWRQRPEILNMFTDFVECCRRPGIH